MWMPAHQAAAASARVPRSDGQAVSTQDWRANRLADVVARSAAMRGAPRGAVTRYVDTAADLLKLEAAALGAVTRAANNHPVDVVTVSGSTVVTTRRDSVTARRDVAARPRRKQPPTLAVPDPMPIRPCLMGRAVRRAPARLATSSAALAAAAAAAAGRKRQRTADALGREHDDFLVREIVAGIAAAAAPSDPTAADERFAALRRRIRDRGSAPIAAASVAPFAVQAVERACAA